MYPFTLRTLTKIYSGIHAYMPLSVIIVLTLLSDIGYAESLYLQAINSATLSDEKLQESIKKIKEHRPVNLREKLEVPPFHKRTPVNVALDNSLCTICHQSPPHTKSIRSRTFMNMHAQYIACETCHFRPKKQPLTYLWQDMRDASIVRAKPELFRQPMKKKSADTAMSTGKTAPKNPFYKISPFYRQQAVVLPRSSAFAQETQKIWRQKGSIKEKATRRAIIHLPLSEKGPKCQACHRDKDAFLDLAQLGATPYQINKIQNNIVAQFFSRYTEEKQRIRITDLLR